MVATALYYPNIEPPLDWLKAYLLFHEDIARLVPKGEYYLDRDDFNLFREKFPDAVIDIPSSLSDRKLSEDTLQRLDTALAEVAKKAGFPPDRAEFNLEIHFAGAEVSMPGFAYVPRSKISKPVNELLDKHGLVLPLDLSAFMPPDMMMSPDPMIIVDKAADLIISLLADGIARDNGIATVTNHSMAYCLVVLNGLGATDLSGSIPGGYVEKLLAASIITNLIPTNLVDISLETYGEIRKEYTELRELLKVLVEQFSPEKLNRITDIELLNQHLEDKTNQFHKKFEETKAKGKILKSIPNWIPFTVSSALAISLALSPASPLEIKLAASGVSIVVRFYERIRTQRKPSDSSKDWYKFKRQLAGLESDLKSINEPGFFRKFSQHR